MSVSGGDGLSKGAGGAGLSGRRRSGRRALTVARSSSCVLPSPLSLSALCLGRGAHARVGLFGAQGESELKFWVGEIGFDPGGAHGNGVPLCACAVGAGGGQDITSLLGSTVSSVTNKTSCNGARRRPSGVTTSRGFVLLVHWDWLETQGWVPYDGGAVPDSVPEVGLGVVGTPILWRWVMLHTRMLGGGSRWRYAWLALRWASWRRRWLPSWSKVRLSSPRSRSVGPSISYLSWGLVVTWVRCREKAQRFCTGDDDAPGRRSLFETSSWMSFPRQSSK